MASKKAKGGGCKTAGRSLRKQKARLLPLSKYVRGRISAKQYFELTGQKVK